MAKATTKASSPDVQNDLNELIRARAYQLYEERGRIDGHDVEDWLQAEAETRDFHSHKAAA